MPATALDVCLVIQKYLKNDGALGNKRAGRGHDFPRRSLHLRIALGKLLERSRRFWETSARVAATVFQEGAINSGMLMENYWKDPAKISKNYVNIDPK